MKNLVLISIIIAVFLALMFASAYPAEAFDGDIYAGKYINSTLRSRPGGSGMGTAEYVAGVEVGHKLFSDRFRPYLKLETLMDSYVDDASFHPASIKYEIGGRFEIYKGIYFDASHLCWHPIDSGGVVEQYNLVKIGIKF